MQEEIFGPVLPVLTFKEIQEALQFVKEREKPLALYLFTRDKKTERKVLGNLSFGGGCINDTIIHLLLRIWASAVWAQRHGKLSRKRKL